ncbi:MAG TPA: hypothetical protein VFG07_03025 [Thermoplasmata archaeon]|nr:hypothetical protein [Thermoplasmata archaeon]
MDVKAQPGRVSAEERLSQLLAVAGEYGTGIALEELSALLPVDFPDNVAGLTAWIRNHPDRASVADGVATAPWASLEGLHTLGDRRLRGEEYWSRVIELFEGPLSPLRGLVHSAAVTGSAAYREPAPGDDLDVMTITSKGAVWLFLAWAFASLRWSRRAAPPSGSHWCFNYVLDEPTARQQYSKRGDYLFAREALTARPLFGRGRYRALLADAAWMRDELPRLYASRLAEEAPCESPAAPRGWAGRLTSLAIYPWLAAYLQCAGLYRNHRFRRSGQADSQFKTVTRPGVYALHTERYARLAQIYGGGREGPSG